LLQSASVKPDRIGRGPHNGFAPTVYSGKKMEPSLEGLRVLVFGTEKDSTEWLKKSLIHHGALVSTVDSAKKVLRVLKNIRMDLLIVDCHSSDAYPLIRAIRLRDSRSGANVAAVLLSKDGSKREAMR
jgi:DNA-binding response OmpR family regulator